MTKLVNYDVKMRSNKIQDIQSADQQLLYQGGILISEF